MVCGLYLQSLVEKVTDQSGEGGAQALVYLILAAGFFLLWLVPAFEGNRWREENLLKRGYEQLTTVQVETPDAAIAQGSQVCPTLRSSGGCSSAS